MPRGTLTYICEVTSMKKKIIAAIAAFAMSFALCSCGRSADDSEPAAAQPSEVTTAETAETAAETAAVTTAPQSEPTTTTTAKGEPTTTTTAESETTTSENTTTADVTTTSDSKTTTTAEKKTTTAKQTAAPKKTTTAKQTAAPKKTTTTPKKTTAKPATTTKRVWTRELTTEEYWSLDWEEQRDYTNWLLSQPPTVKLHSKEEIDKIMNDFVQECLNLVNKERQNVGLSPLQLDPTLQKMAMQRSEEEHISTPHIRPDGTPCYTIFNEYDTSLNYNGENCAYMFVLDDGKQLAKVAVESWMDSDGHKENILRPNSTYIGIGGYAYQFQTLDGISGKYYTDEGFIATQIFAY